MLVRFKTDVTWTDRSCKKGEVIELGDALSKRFIEKGFCEQVIKDLEEDDKAIVKIIHRANSMGGDATGGKRSAKSRNK